MWLKNDKHLIEYLRRPSYEFVYRNRDKKRGVGVEHTSEIRQNSRYVMT